MPSAAFDRFRFSFFEDTDSARQGLEKTALAQLEGDERAQAEDMLLRYLPDSRAVSVAVTGGHRGETVGKRRKSLQFPWLSEKRGCVLRITSPIPRQT
jgi:hypothetical protein